jgi:hypothetical protein
MNGRDRERKCRRRGGPGGGVEAALNMPVAGRMGESAVSDRRREMTRVGQC